MKNYTDIFLYKDKLFLTIQKVDLVCIKSQNHDFN